jgi:DNA-binding NtrC family response regulator
MTGKPSVDSSIEAFRSGAWDYLSKPFSATQLSILIGRATHTVQIGRDAERSVTRRGRTGTRRGTVVLGDSPAFRKAIDLARKVAPTDASVFITGDSGTGKDLVAQLIHERSRRSSRELVAVNCAALPEGLLESEMFGHVKGSFTGATQDKQGLLEQANGGTLFLDELTEMSLGIQAKLLRAIQDGVVRRVGSTSTSALVNVRFVAATNRDPAEALREGQLGRTSTTGSGWSPSTFRPSGSGRRTSRCWPSTSSRPSGRSTGTTRTGPVPTPHAEALEALRRRPWTRERARACRT